MLNRKFTKFALYAVFAGLLATGAQAHQIVAQATDTNKFEAKFWAHGSFEDYKPEQLLGAKAYDASLKPIKTGIIYSRNDAKKSPQILTQKSPAVITTSFDAQYWVQTDAGYVVGERTVVDGVVFDAIKSIKIGKTYLEWNENLLSPIGLKLEVIALSDPFALKVGDKLPVLVLKDGKPLAKVGFEDAKDDLDVVTNEFGIALIPIKAKGLNIIAARSQEPLFGDAKAERMLLQSSISFELK